MEAEQIDEPRRGHRRAEDDRGDDHWPCRSRLLWSCALLLLRSLGGSGNGDVQRVEDRVKRPTDPCKAALKDAGMNAGEIDEVILVGGMTRMPAVQRHIASIFGKQPLKVVNPDEIVSVGAATQVALLDGRFEGVVLLDVTSRTIGVHVDGGRYQ